MNMIILDSKYQLLNSNYDFYSEKILFIQENLYNDVDKQIWKSLINALVDNNNNHLLFENYLYYSDQQYLDCVNINNNDNIIEGGIFDGITSSKIAKYLQDWIVYAFDPLSENEKYELLNNRKIKIIRQALWSKVRNLYFINNGAGSYVAEDIFPRDIMTNYSTIKATTVDYFISNNKLAKFDFLKLDVEGAELNVLYGAIESIKQFRPQLAISIYHSLDDFFSIPHLLMSELSNYNFQIRLYSAALMDTVLYAIPKEKFLIKPYTTNKKGTIHVNT